MLIELLQGDSRAALAQVPSNWSKTPSDELDGLLAHLRLLAATAKARECDDPELDEEWLEQLFQRGLFTLTVPRDCGGLDADLGAFAATMRALGHLPPAYAITAVPHLCIAVKSLACYGQAETRRKVLGSIGEKRRLIAFAITEDHGSDVAAMHTRLVRADDGSLRLRGRKQWVTNLARADHVVVTALCPSLHRAPGAAVWISLPLNAPNVRAAVASWDKITASGSDTGDVYFDDVLVAPEWLIGEPGYAMQHFNELVLPGRLGTAAAALGMTEAALTAGFPSAQSPDAAWLVEAQACVHALASTIALVAALGDAKHAQFGHATALVKYVAGICCQELLSQARLRWLALGMRPPALLSRAHAALGLFRLLKGPGEVIAYQAITALTARLRSQSAQAPAIAAEGTDTLAAHCAELSVLAAQLGNDPHLARQQAALMELAWACALVLIESATTASASASNQSIPHALNWSQKRSHSALVQLRQSLSQPWLYRIDEDFLRCTGGGMGAPLFPQLSPFADTPAQ